MTNKVTYRSIFLVLCDIGAVMAAHILANHVRANHWDFAVLALPQTYASIVIFILIFYIFDLYFPFKYFKRGEIIIDIAIASSIGMILSASVAYLDRTFTIPRLTFAYAIAFLIPIVFIVRYLCDVLFKTKILDKRTFVLGTGPLAQEIIKVIGETPHPGIEIIGIVSESKYSDPESNNGIPVLGDLSRLVSLIDWYRIEFVVLAMDPSAEASETQVMADILRKKVMVTSSIHLYERLTGEVPHRLLGSHYLLGLMAQVKARPYLKLKRVSDIIFGFLLLLALSPIILLAMMLLAISGPRKIFFMQDRIGMDGIAFKLFKLRSMTEERDGRQVITRIGKWLRKYRIDEIPQLLNVLKGEMSLIGPRPEIPYFVDRCREKIPFYDMVFTLKPGITGWAQVKFRYTTTIKDYEKKFRFNLYYIKNISLTLDLLVILKTIRVVLLGKGY